jgi:hypothetical protein
MSAWPLRAEGLRPFGATAAGRIWAVFAIHARSLSIAFASLRSRVSKPSVKRP